MYILESINFLVPVKLCAPFLIWSYV